MVVGSRDPVAAFGRSPNPAAWTCCPLSRWNQARRRGQVSPTDLRGNGPQRRVRAVLRCFRSSSGPLPCYDLPQPPALQKGAGEGAHCYRSAALAPAWRLPWIERSSGRLPRATVPMARQGPCVARRSSGLLCPAIARAWVRPPRSRSRQSRSAGSGRGASDRRMACCSSAVRSMQKPRLP